MSDENTVKIWDPLVRIFHWSLVVAFFIAYFTEDEFLQPHIWAGYTVLGLVGFRLLWGFVGTPHARFSDFVTAPRIALAYGRDAVLGRARRYLGHNPAGGLMIVVLLISLIVTTVTGVALYGVEERAGPLAGLFAGAGEEIEKGLENVHEFFANFTLFLVAIHVAGVVVEGLLHRENLVRAMFTGRKRAL